MLDILLLLPGIHHEQTALEVNEGEYPTTSAMTTGYVFRMENQAMIGFLLRIGEEGHLTNVSVSPPRPANYGWIVDQLCTKTLPSVFYLMAIGLTVVVMTLLATINDWWGLGVIGMLMLVRLLSTAVNDGPKRDGKAFRNQECRAIFSSHSARIVGCVCKGTWMTSWQSPLDGGYDACPMSRASPPVPRLCLCSALS